MDSPKTARVAPRGAFYSALGANTLDKATTYYGLSMGLQEANPAYRGIMQLTGTNTGLLIGYFASTLCFYILYKRSHKIALYAFTSALLAVGIYNLLIIGGIL